MIRKIITPIAFFLFGMVIALVESSIDLPTDSNDISYNGVNLFNKIFIITVLIIIVVFEVRTQFKNITKPLYKYSYLLITLILLVLTAYYWIQFLEWK